MGEMLRGKERTEADGSQARWQGAHLPAPAPPPLQGPDRNNKKRSTSLAHACCFDCQVSSRSPWAAVKLLLVLDCAAFLPSQTVPQGLSPLLLPEPPCLVVCV